MSKNSSESDQLLIDLFDNLPVSALLIDHSSAIVDANKIAVKFYGCSKKQLIGKNIVELCPEWMQPRVAYELNCALAGRHKFVSEEWQQITSDKKIIDVKAYTELISADVAILMIVIVDISHYKQVEKELLVSLEELDCFVYRAAQNLKAPLAHIEGVCNLVKAEGKIGDLHALVYFDMVQNASAQINYTLSKLLMFNNLKNRSPEIQPVNIFRLVNRVIEEVQLHKRIDITLLIEMPPQMTVNSDETLIAVILRNLLENAVAYRDPSYRNAYVRIAAYFMDGQLIINVVDNGLGIPKEVMPHLFTNTYAGTESVRGGGIGLYASQVAAAKLGGKIELVCNKTGQTQFTVTLPLNSVQSKDAKALSAQEASVHKK
ncbi:ATP-binding protein [Rhodoflexus sp.]